MHSTAHATPKHTTLQISRYSGRLAAKNVMVFDRNHVRSAHSRPDQTFDGTRGRRKPDPHAVLYANVLQQPRCLSLWRPRARAGTDTCMLVAPHRLRSRGFGCRFGNTLHLAGFRVIYTVFSSNDYKYGQYNDSHVLFPRLLPTQFGYISTRRCMGAHHGIEPCTRFTTAYEHCSRFIRRRAGTDWQET